MKVSSCVLIFEVWLNCYAFLFCHDFPKWELKKKTRCKQMIGVNMNSLPHERKVSYQMIKYIRLCRNMTQEQFGEACKMDRSVLAKLERGELPLSPHYESKIMDGIRALNISQLELVSVKRIVELKEQRIK